MVPGAKGGVEPEGGQFNFDHDNREAPPKNQDTLGVEAPWYPVEDDIDREVRDYLDHLGAAEGIQFVGRTGPRLFRDSRRSPRSAGALCHYETGDVWPPRGRRHGGDWAMSHSLLSPALNLGLLDPTEVIERVLGAYHAGGWVSPVQRALSAR